MTSTSSRRLERIPAEGKIAGVCAGIANYFDMDVALVRGLWVLLSIVPGTIIGGVLVYAAAWLLMPESTVPVTLGTAKRVVRPRLNRQVAGVCAGLARYFNVDVTLVRLLWVVLAIYPGVIILGVLAYGIAWFVIPAEPHIPMEPAVHPL